MLFNALIDPFSLIPKHGTGDLEIGDAYVLSDKIKQEKKEAEVNTPPVSKSSFFKFGKFW